MRLKTHASDTTDFAVLKLIKITALLIINMHKVCLLANKSKKFKE